MDADPDEIIPPLSPADTRDPILELLKKDLDYTLLRENLKLTPEQRFEKMEQAIRCAAEFRRAGLEARKLNGRSHPEASRNSRYRSGKLHRCARLGGDL